MAGFNAVFAGLGDNKTDFLGAIPVAMYTITFGAADTYLTGGLALTAANFGLSRPIAGVLVVGQNTASVGQEWNWNSQTQKLQAIQSTTGAPAAFVELANTTSIANFAMTVLVLAQR